MSISNMIKSVGGECEIIAQTTLLEPNDKVILPGVGHFDHCMRMFRSKGFEAMVDQIREKEIITLGICAGAQMLTKQSEEGGEKGLGLIDAETVAFDFKATGLVKIPHMGWNIIKIKRENDLLTSSSEDLKFYFVHSYHFKINQNDNVIASVSHGYDFPCAFQNKHIFGVQFHPEKSHSFGKQLFRNFIDI